MTAKKERKDIGDNAWRNIIENAYLNEDSWKVQVVMVEAAGSDQDRIYLNKFESFASDEKRFVVRNICKTETIFMVNQLGCEKKVKDDNLRVFEEAQTFIKDKKDIPSDIYALIIKHLILKMKEEYRFVERQRLEVKEGLRRESATMLVGDELRDNVKVNQSEPVPLSSLPKGKSKKNAIAPTNMIPEPEEGKKYNTQLRVRGEEWRDKTYVDDFPIDGPNLYIVLTGFYDAYLLSNLIRIGVSISAVIQIRIDVGVANVPSTLIKQTKRGHSQTEILADKAVQFWEDLQMLRLTNTGVRDFKNTAFIIFSPPYWDSDKLSGSPEKIYDELCFLMYDIQDLTRQHQHYLENMEIINIPENYEDNSIIKSYCQKIEDIPLECVTIYSVLDAILQTVCRVTNIEDDNSTSSLSSALTLNRSSKNEKSNKVNGAENFMKEVFNTLCKTEATKKAFRLTNGEEYDNHTPPIIISYGDFVNYSTFHVGNINMDSIVWSSLYHMPLHKLWNSQDIVHGDIGVKINYHVNVLLSSFERHDIETAELNRLMHILACRKLYNNRSSLKVNFTRTSTINEMKKKYLKRSILAEPLRESSSLRHHCVSRKTSSCPSMTKSELSKSSYNDDFETNRVRFLFDCPDISALLTTSELINGIPDNHMIDNFEYFEDFTGIRSFQILLDSFNKYNCVNYEYCQITDCFILMFFNSFDVDGISRNEWRSHLVTPICLQDFFDFVLEEAYEWLQTEEKCYDEAMTVKSQSECKVILDPYALKSCVTEVNVASDLLMEGSLKYLELSEINDIQKLESPPSPHQVSPKLSTPTPSTDTNSKSSRKAKSPSSKTRKQSFVQSSISDFQSEMPPKPFLGYNLSDRRVEAFGRDESYFSYDGTRVFCKYTMLIPANSEYITMNIITGNGNNEFWTHKCLTNEVTSKTLNACESFRIKSKDGVFINIKKHTFDEPLLTVSPYTDVNCGAYVEKISKSDLYHTFTVTWPNGQITETVYENHNPYISHVKQYYSCSRLAPTMRCITLDGEVISFNENGDVHVLKSDGSVIKITKHYNKPVVPKMEDISISDASNEKNKKSKSRGKNYNTDKSSKTSPKSNSTDELPIQYEYVIEEFETIESSGLRQNWVNNIPHTIEKLLIRTATDYCLGEIFSRRMDGTNTFLNKDGIQVVTFPDKTRIITKIIVEDNEIYPEWTEDELYLYRSPSTDTITTNNTEKSRVSISQRSPIRSQVSVGSSKKKVKINTSVIIKEDHNKDEKRMDGYVSVQFVYTIEHSNYASVTINKSTKEISVASPNNTIVSVNSDNNYKIILDEVTTSTFDGENLHISCNACPECKSSTTCDIKLKSNGTCGNTHKQSYWLKMKDSFSKQIIVTEEGNIELYNEIKSNEKVFTDEVNLNKESNEVKGQPYCSSHGKCSEMHLAQNVRFFALRRDLSCSELVHRSLLELDERECRSQPWCSVNEYDTFGDHRSLLSVLKPIRITETEKWLMDSELADKPKYLTYKDLKEDSGKGFYHWMRPYKRFKPKPMKPENVLPPRLPRAFILRTLERQWKENDRETHKGARELIRAILRYRETVEASSKTILNVPLVDMRSEDERHIDEAIQALAHRIYEDLKAKLAEDIQSRAKVDITTKPVPVRNITADEDILEEELNYEQLLNEKEHQSLIKDVEDAEPLSPKLRKYWRRRSEDYQEEQFYKHLLRESSVPPYFRNLLGGAIWGQVSEVTEEAVTKSERRQGICSCEPVQGTENGGHVAGSRT